jgi:hypothetical protein
MCWQWGASRISIREVQAHNPMLLVSPQIVENVRLQRSSTKFLAIARRGKPTYFLKYLTCSTMDICVLGLVLVLKYKCQLTHNPVRFRQRPFPIQAPQLWRGLGKPLSHCQSTFLSSCFCCCLDFKSRCSCSGSFLKKEGLERELPFLFFVGRILLHFNSCLSNVWSYKRSGHSVFSQSRHVFNGRIPALSAAIVPTVTFI